MKLGEGQKEKENTSRKREIEVKDLKNGDVVALLVLRGQNTFFASITTPC